MMNILLVSGKNIAIHSVAPRNLEIIFDFLFPLLFIAHKYAVSPEFKQQTFLKFISFSHSSGLYHFLPSSMQQPFRRYTCLHSWLLKYILLEAVKMILQRHTRLYHCPVPLQWLTIAHNVWTFRDLPGGPVARTLHSQWRCLGSISGQKTRSLMLQLRASVPELKIPHAATKIWHSQINI